MVFINNEKPSVSVIIPSYNSSQYIRHCLHSLMAQTCEIPFEIIVIDSSDDGTDLIVTKDFPLVKMLHSRERTFVGTARNIGIDQAEGEIILFLDTDCVAPLDWIDRIYQIFQNTKADGVGGALKNGTPLSVTGTAGYYLEFFRFFPSKSHPHDVEPRPVTFLIGANCGFRKEVFETIRYYDDYDITKVGEDFYFCWQLSQEQKKLVFVSSVSVSHLNKTGLLPLMRYQYKFGIGACSYRSHVSTRIMSVLIKFPYLTLLFPIAVIPWIGSYVLKRLGVLDFLKFIIILPIIFIGNFVWAIGFLNGLKILNQNKS